MVLKGEEAYLEDRQHRHMLYKYSSTSIVFPPSRLSSAWPRMGGRRALSLGQILRKLCRAFVRIFDSCQNVDFLVAFQCPAMRAQVSVRQQEEELERSVQSRPLSNSGRESPLQAEIPVEFL
jgi:hypothetical protein